RDGVDLALERHSRERRTLDARGCLYYRGRRAPSSPLVATRVDRPLPAQMLILSVWLSPVCRSAPAGFQTADIFLHLRDAPRSAPSRASFSGQDRGASRSAPAQAPAWPPSHQAALTSIILGTAARGAGILTSSMPFAYFASTWAPSTPSGSAKLRSNPPYATS